MKSAPARPILGGKETANNATDILKVTFYRVGAPTDEEQAFTVAARTVSISDDGRLLVEYAAGKKWDMGSGTWGGLKVVSVRRDVPVERNRLTRNPHDDLIAQRLRSLNQIDAQHLARHFLHAFGGVTVKSRPASIAWRVS